MATFNFSNYPYPIVVGPDNENNLWNRVKTGPMFFSAGEQIIGAYLETSDNDGEKNNPTLDLEMKIASNQGEAITESLLPGKTTQRQQSFFKNYPKSLFKQSSPKITWEQLEQQQILKPMTLNDLIDIQSRLSSDRSNATREKKSTKAKEATIEEQKSLSEQLEINSTDREKNNTLKAFFHEHKCISHQKKNLKNQSNDSYAFYTQTTKNGSAVYSSPQGKRWQTPVPQLIDSAKSSEVFPDRMDSRSRPQATLKELDFKSFDVGGHLINKMPNEQFENHNCNYNEKIKGKILEFKKWNHKKGRYENGNLELSAGGGWFDFGVNKIKARIIDADQKIIYSWSKPYEFINLSPISYFRTQLENAIGNPIFSSLKYFKSEQGDAHAKEEKPLVAITEDQNGIDLELLKDHDQLIGTQFNDTLDAGAGNDTIIGAQGINQLTGGDGEDIFQLHPLGHQVIQDYDPRSDVIDLGELARKDIVVTRDQKAVIIQSREDETFLATLPSLDRDTNIKLINRQLETINL